MTETTAAFFFGALAFHGWIFWFVLGIVLFIEAASACYRVAEEEFGLVTFFVLAILATLHVSGIVDVITLVRHNWLKTAEYIGGYLAFGLLIYAPIAGWLTAYLSRTKFQEQLRNEKSHFLSRKGSEWERTNGRTPMDQATSAANESEWQTKVKPEAWRKITDVEKDKNRIFRWTLFWPFHLLWHTMFRWLVNLKDLYDAIWNRCKTIAQTIKSSALHGADKDI